MSVGILEIDYKIKCLQDRSRTLQQEGYIARLASLFETQISIPYQIGKLEAERDGGSRLLTGWRKIIEKNFWFAGLLTLAVLYLGVSLGEAYHGGFFAVSNLKGMTGYSCGITALFLLGRYLYVYRRIRQWKISLKEDVMPSIPLTKCQKISLYVAFFLSLFALSTSILCYYQEIPAGYHFIVTHGKAIGAGMSAAVALYLFAHLVKEGALLMKSWCSESSPCKKAKIK